MRNMNKGTAENKTNSLVYDIFWILFLNFMLSKNEQNTHIIKRRNAFE